MNDLYARVAELPLRVEGLRMEDLGGIDSGSGA